MELVYCSGILLGYPSVRRILLALYFPFTWTKLLELLPHTSKYFYSRIVVPNGWGTTLWEFDSYANMQSTRVLTVGDSFAQKKVQ